MSATTFTLRLAGLLLACGLITAFLLGLLP